MADQELLQQIVDLLERQMAVDLHFQGANQNTIARVLRKSKTWVNELVRVLPKASTKG